MPECTGAKFYGSRLGEMRFLCDLHGVDEVVRDFEGDRLEQATLQQLTEHMLWHEEQMKIESVQEEIRERA